MGTTIHPLPNGGPLDDDYGPTFPPETGRGMATQSRLLEAGRKLRKPKKIIKEAEGVLNPPHSRVKKVKMGTKPKNLRASGKGRKRGAFGEAYSPAPASGKGIRVAESAHGVSLYEALREAKHFFEHRASRYLRRGYSLHESRRRAIEKAPPGWEGTVKHMKKHPEISNPWALSWWLKNQGDTSHK